MPAEFRPTGLPSVVVVQPQVFPDGRGYFLETFKASEYASAGITGPFVQSNHSSSSKGVLRGLHYQLPPHDQGKLVRVAKGRVWDVSVDVRRGSKTFGQWFGLELSEENHSMVWIPGGFAHGFVSLEDDSHLIYQCSREYRKDAEAGLRWNDPELDIKWPILAGEVSPKDVALPSLNQAKLFPVGYEFSWSHS